ncbi:MAG: FAD-binding oxidoreductase [Candidatus Rokubacteria bacterium]|nr:FAD-binding oxidoreductase [Candidatus Rokubacteria bacterium]
MIGAGAIGTAAAYYLAKAGVGVTVVDRRGVGQEASGANVGLVTLFSAYSFDEPDPGAAYALSIASADAYLTLGEELGVDLEYERCGGVVFAQTDDQLALIRRAYEGYRRQGIPVEWLDAAGVLAAEPAFRCEGILGGVFCPLNGQLNPLMLCRGLAQGARAHGARFMPGTSVEGIETTGGRVRAVRTTAGEIPCEQVVNAAGAWSAALARMVGLDIPVSPGRGQIVLTEPAPRFIHRIVMGASPAARQTRRGNVIIGSALEYAGFDKASTLDTVTGFSRSVLTRFPALRGLSVIRSWAGLRPMTPDHLPIIQMLDAPRGFCLATGHSHRGICYGAGTGQAVADLVMGKPPRLPLDAFRLARFNDSAATEGHR